MPCGSGAVTFSKDFPSRCFFLRNAPRSVCRPETGRAPRSNSIASAPAFADDCPGQGLRDTRSTLSVCTTAGSNRPKGQSRSRRANCPALGPGASAQSALLLPGRAERRHPRARRRTQWSPDARLRLQPRRTLRRDRQAEAWETAGPAIRLCTLEALPTTLSRSSLPGNDAFAVGSRSGHKRHPCRENLADASPVQIDDLEMPIFIHEGLADPGR